MWYEVHLSSNKQTKYKMIELKIVTHFAELGSMVVSSEDFLQIEYCSVQNTFRSNL